MKSQKHQTIDTDIPNRNIKRVIRILSLIAKCNSQGADVRASSLPNSGDAIGQNFIKKGYFSIHFDQDVIKTPSIISRAGELIFAEPRQIEIGNVGTIQFKVWDGFGKINLFGEASMELNEWRPNKKLALVKDTFEVGELYIESRLVSKEQIITTNHTENPFKSLSPKPIPEL